MFCCFFLENVIYFVNIQSHPRSWDMKALISPSTSSWRTLRITWWRVLVLNSSRSSCRFVERQLAVTVAVPLVWKFSTYCLQVRTGDGHSCGPQVVWNLFLCINAAIEEVVTAPAPDHHRELCCWPQCTLFITLKKIWNTGSSDHITATCGPD